MHVLEQRVFDLRRVSKTIEEIAFRMWSVTGGGESLVVRLAVAGYACGLPGRCGGTDGVLWGVAWVFWRR
jgi:hypothetical protein